MYYRNWYQHWQQQKQEAEKIQMMSYFSEVNEQPQHLELYKARREYERPLRSQGSKKDFKKQLVNHRFNRQAKSNKDAIRSIMLGIPLAFVFLTLLYAVGIIPQEMINQWLNTSNNSLIITYANEYDRLINLHNEFNQQLAVQIRNDSLTPDALQVIQSNYAQIRAETERLMEHSDAGFSSMNRLWSLKLMSLTEMITSIDANGEITPEVLEYYNQFVADQNEIGEQMILTLTNLFAENNIDFTMQLDGSIQLR